MLVRARKKVQRDSRLNEVNGIQAPTGGQPLWAGSPRFGEWQLPTSAERKSLPEIKIRIAVELVVVVVRNGRNARIESRPVVQVVGPGVGGSKEHISDKAHIGRSLCQARKQTIVIGVVEAVEGWGKTEGVRIGIWIRSQQLLV